MSPVTWTVDGGGSARMAGAHSFWNQKLPTDFPVDPDSDAYCAGLLTKAYGGNARTSWNNASFSSGIFIAGIGCPRYTVTVDRPTGQADQFKVPDATVNPFYDVPIPNNARPSGPWPAPGGFSDNHMTIYEPSTDTLWEMWKARHVGSAGGLVDDGPSPATGQATGVSSVVLNTPGWHMQYGGAMKNASQSAGYYDNAAWNGQGNGWGSTATKMPRAFGMITTSEGLAAKAGTPNAIPHAISCAIGQPRRYPHFRWPAQTTDGFGSPDVGNPEEGMIFRFRPDADYAALKATHPFIGAVCEAIRDYGLVIMDQSAALSMYCEQKNMSPSSQSGVIPDVWYGSGVPDTYPTASDAVFDAAPYNNASNTYGMPQYLPWGDLQLVGMSYRPTSSTKRRLLFGV